VAKKNPDVAGRMSELLDKAMIGWLENGTPLLDQEGQAVLDGEGNPVMRALTPAEADKIMKRIAQIGKVGTAGVGPMSTAAELEAMADEKIRSGEIRFDGKTRAIPALDVEGDDEAMRA